VGACIALAGVTFFFLQASSFAPTLSPLVPAVTPSASSATGRDQQLRTVSEKPSPTPKTTEVLFFFGSRFGVLFFIEFVAFFFLRQYRATMDEFRYYETAQRNREDNLMILVLSQKDWGSLDFFRVVSLCSFQFTDR
jgi:hypothetical protein